MSTGYELLTVRSVDDGLAIVLTPELAAKLSAVEGGQVIVTYDRDGSATIAPAASAFDRQMAVARQVMRNDRVMLATLAKL